jgi:hypothetical protein
LQAVSSCRSCPSLFRKRKNHCLLPMILIQHPGIRRKGACDDAEDAEIGRSQMSLLGATKLVALTVNTLCHSGCATLQLGDLCRLCHAQPVNLGHSAGCLATQHQQPITFSSTIHTYTSTQTAACSRARGQPLAAKHYYIRCMPYKMADGLPVIPPLPLYAGKIDLFLGTASTCCVDRRATTSAAESCTL